MNKQVGRITVQRILLFLGFSPKLEGYRHLIDAILELYGLYPLKLSVNAICSKLSSAEKLSGDAVEKRMKYAVERTYKQNDLDGVNTMYNASVLTQCPTLYEFLMLITEYLHSFYKNDDLFCDGAFS